MSGERGQIAIAAVGAMTALLLGAVVLVHLARIRVEGGHSQRAADLAALAAARVLASDPQAPPSELRRAAAGAAGQNGARLAWLRVQRRGGVPAAVELGVTVTVDGTLPVAGRRSDPLPARARAGVTYSAALPERSFRPVDLHGATGRAAAVAAAEAQIGWPYVWGGESRAEGGFDCSGLVDYAYAQAGLPLPGRPTAADLWRMAQPIAPDAMQPGDLVFMGAPSGAPYHVGMYAGDGWVVVAPHTGAEVEFEALAGAGWDGFGRLLDAGPAAPPATAVERAARRHQVPANILAAELELGLATDPEHAAAALESAQRRHPGDLVGALTDALGDPSAAALVVRAAAGPGLSGGFAGSVKLLPEPVAGTASGSESLPVLPPVVSPVPPGPAAAGSAGGWRGAFGQVADAVVGGADRVAGMAADGERGGRAAMGGLGGLRHISRLSLSLLSLVPDRTVSAFASAAGSVWDITAAAAELANGALQDGLVVAGTGLWATRVTTAGAVFTMIAGGVLLATARTRRDRLLGGLQAAGGALQVAGFATAGTDLIALGAVGMEVPPVGVALIATGTLITGGVVLYQSWPAVSAAGGSAIRWAGRRARGVVHGVRSAAGAAWDGARSLASALSW